LSGKIIPVNSANPTPKLNAPLPKFSARRNDWKIKMGAPTRLITALTGPYLKTENTNDQTIAEVAAQAIADDMKLPLTLSQEEIQVPSGLKP
jgi:hypothetical protein